MWQPIETAPKDRFLLLCGPSGYTTTPMVVTTGRMCSDYHAGRWIDHANDDLTDWGFRPTHWAPLIIPGAQAGSDGRFADMKPCTGKCRKCGAEQLSFRTVESSCGGYEDYEYGCRACGYTWWVDGIDS